MFCDRWPGWQFFFFLDRTHHFHFHSYQLEGWALGMTLPPCMWEVEEEEVSNVVLDQSLWVKRCFHLGPLLVWSPQGSSCPLGSEPKVEGLWVHLSLQWLAGCWLSLIGSLSEEHMAKSLFWSERDHLVSVVVGPLQPEEAGQLEEKEWCLWEQVGQEGGYPLATQWEEENVLAQQEEVEILVKEDSAPLMEGVI